MADARDRGEWCLTGTKDINKLYESINELLNNNEKRKELGKQAQKRANEDFNWDSVANKYLKNFKS